MPSPEDLQKMQDLLDDEKVRRFLDGIPKRPDHSPFRPPFIPIEPDPAEKNPN
jgi:hypothetical protein